MDIKDCFKIGFVLKPHGLKGGVTLSIDAEFPEEFTPETVFLQDGEHLVPYFIQDISFKGSKAFVKFEEVDSVEAAAAVSKRAVFLPKAARQRSARGEFYDDEVTGFSVTDEVLGEIGAVRNVINAGANRLLAVDHNGNEVLIPVNGPFIRSLNKSKKKITVLLPEGFLDI